MRLIYAYVENFGTLHQFSYEFNEGINGIEQENGWGKSTFAAFLKAMFFGMEYSTSKIKITDRKRYYPWNGNKFGGYLIVQINQKTYRVERFFGRREKDDTFDLYDQKTNIQSKDFSEKIGEEIWKVDRDSFEKTAFITLQEFSLLNDIIAGKLGETTSQEADVEESGKVIKKLDEAMVKLKAKKGSSGLIDQTIIQQEEIKEKLRKCEKSQQELDDAEYLMKEYLEKKSCLEANIQEIEIEIKNQVLFERKKNYEQLLAEIKEVKEKRQTLEVFFQQQVPDSKFLAELTNLSLKVRVLQDKIRECELSKEQQVEYEELSLLFGKVYPKEQELTSKSKLVSQYQGKIALLSDLKEQVNQKRLEQLQSKYQVMDITIDQLDEYMQQYQESEHLKEKIIDLERENTIHTDLGRKDKGNKIPLFSILGLLIFATGLGLLLLSVPMGLILTGLGVALFALTILFSFSNKIKRRRKQTIDLRVQQELKLKEWKEKRDSLLQGFTFFLQEMHTTENPLIVFSQCKAELLEYEKEKQIQKEFIAKKDLLEKEIEDSKKEIEAFLNHFFTHSSWVNEELALVDLRTKQARFQVLVQQYNQYCDKKASLKKVIESLELGLKPYSIQSSKEIETVIDELKEKKTQFDYLFDKEKELEEKIREIKTNYCVEDFIGLLPPKSIGSEAIEEIDLRKQQFREQKDQLMEKISAQNSKIIFLRESVDQIEDLETKLEETKTTICTLKEKYHLLDQTKNLIQQAKENLASRYTNDIYRSFSSYFELMNSTKEMNYKVDISLEVYIEHEGELHQSKKWSRGMKDLIQICMRMALVDAVYKDVKNPILILDDPFANLDNERLDKGLAFLKEIEKCYQIVYFTCHQSRAI